MEKLFISVSVLLLMCIILIIYALRQRKKELELSNLRYSKLEKLDNDLKSLHIRIVRLEDDLAKVKKELAELKSSQEERMNELLNSLTITEGD
jgi:uncharacterized protein YlxW (UPF0749 family)